MSMILQTEISAQAQSAVRIRHTYSGICWSSDLTAGCADIRDEEANSTNSSWTEFPEGKKGQTEKLWMYATLTDSLTQQVNSGLKGT